MDIVGECELDRLGAVACLSDDFEVGAESSTMRSPSRTTVWSSASKMRVLSGTVIHPSLGAARSAGPGFPVPEHA